LTLRVQGITTNKVDWKGRHDEAMIYCIEVVSVFFVKSIVCMENGNCVRKATYETRNLANRAGIRNN
jgi:hypothetical protein